MIGDGHPVGVSAQVIEYLLRAAKRRLGIYYPVFAPKGIDEAFKIAFGSIRLFALPENFSFPFSKAFLNCAINLPRNTSDMAKAENKCVCRGRP